MTGGGIHSSEDFWHWVLADEARVMTLRAAVQERQSTREYAMGDYWVLSPTIGGAPAQLTHPNRWVVWQLHRPATNDGIVTLLRRPNASDASFTLQLRGLSTSSGSSASVSGTKGAAGSSSSSSSSSSDAPVQFYNVSFAHGYDIDRVERMAADDLASLVLQLPPESSLLLRYAAIQA